MQNVRKSLVAGNWKMNGSQQLLQSFVEYFSQREPIAADVVLCPPAVYLGQASSQLSNTDVLLAAQDVSANSEGAHTGDVSVAMLRDVGCQMAIVGHSERRTDHAESNALVAKKAKALIDGGLIPIVCVGEPLEVRQDGEEEAYVEAQLKAVFEQLSVAELAKVVIAYEPIWAIGTGQTASPEQAQAMHAFIRQLLSQIDSDLAQKIRLLYGGSVKASNAQELFAQIDIDGGLIGGASLKPEEFEAICRAAKA
ncbi:triose-phosphate isomerase [Alteromonas flava]|uniref:triose-phosphate isomerase n=1 Tax=Alteromonas flava TaxID=2048003 RepID=UPI000C2859F6|nr:triose-phosphate isomerase [Alteromonas flava]